MKNPKDAIDWAIQVSENLPEKYRESAFPELLRYALASEEISKSETRNAKVPLEKIVTPSPMVNVLNNLPEAHLLATKGNRDQHVAWAVAELNSRGEEAINVTIRKIIKEHLAVTPPTRQNTNRSLRNLTPKYIIRAKTGKKYHYVSSAKLAEIFKDLKDEK